MTSPRVVPRLASALLRRVQPDNDPLVGDILEEFSHGRSRLWLWRQVVSAAAARWQQPAEIRPLHLVDERLTTLRTITQTLRPIRSLDAVNLSGSPIRGVGGLGITFLVVLSVMTQPGVAVLAAAGVLLGAGLGWLQIVRGRRTHWTEPASLSHIYHRG